jgi:para-nitrobenzyl esterase
MYRFDWKSHVSTDLGACHAIEVPFVLDNFSAPLSEEIVGPNPPMGLSDIMMDSWIAFVRTGDPNSAGLPFWPRYDAKRRATMIFNEHIATQDDPNKATRLSYENINDGL